MVNCVRKMKFLQQANKIPLFMSASIKDSPLKADIKSF